MGTNCAPLVADLFLFSYERDFMMSLSDDKQADVIDAFNTTSRYLDDILNITNVYFDNMVSQIYPSELQLNKANTSYKEATFLDWHLSISTVVCIVWFRYFLIILTCFSDLCLLLYFNPLRSYSFFGITAIVHERDRPVQKYCFVAEKGLIFHFIGSF